MPQTYIRAVRPGAVGRTWRVAVSYSRSGRPVPGSRGTGGVGQERMQPRYLPGSTVTVMLRPSELAVPHPGVISRGGG